MEIEHAYHVDWRRPMDQCLQCYPIKPENIQKDYAFYTDSTLKRRTNELNRFYFIRNTLAILLISLCILMILLILKV